MPPVLTHIRGTCCHLHLSVLRCGGKFGLREVWCATEEQKAISLGGVGGDLVVPDDFIEDLVESFKGAVRISGGDARVRGQDADADKQAPKVHSVAIVPLLEPLWQSSLRGRFEWMGWSSEGERMDES